MVGRLERGQAAPSLDTIEKMARAFTVAPAIVLGGAPITDDASSDRERMIQGIVAMLIEADDDDLERIEQVIGAMTGR